MAKWDLIEQFALHREESAYQQVLCRAIDVTHFQRSSSRTTPTPEFCNITDTLAPCEWEDILIPQAEPHKELEDSRCQRQRAPSRAVSLTASQKQTILKRSLLRPYTRHPGRKLRRHSTHRSLKYLLLLNKTDLSDSNKSNDLVEALKKKNQHECGKVVVKKWERRREVEGTCPRVLQPLPINHISAPTNQSHIS